jgi:hypothetical protein
MFTPGQPVTITYPRAPSRPGTVVLDQGGPVVWVRWYSARHHALDDLAGQQRFPRRSHVHQIPRGRLTAGTP